MRLTKVCLIPGLAGHSMDKSIEVSNAGLARDNSKSSGIEVKELRKVLPRRFTRRYPEKVGPLWNLPAVRDYSITKSLRKRSIIHPSSIRYK